MVETLLPDEIRGAFPRKGQRQRLPGVVSETCGAGLSKSNGSVPANIEELDFMRGRHLRKAIYARERGHCFYCMRRIASRMQCLDHVLPRVHMGRNSYRNLVCCCLDCNSRKGGMAAKDFLRLLS